MTNLARGLAAAGLLNVLPGRLTNRIVPDGAGWDGFAMAVLPALVMAALIVGLQRVTSANHARG